MRYFQSEKRQEGGQSADIYLNQFVSALGPTRLVYVPYIV